MFNTHDQLEHNYTYKSYFTARVAQLINMVFRVLAGSRGFHSLFSKTNVYETFGIHPASWSMGMKGSFPRRKAASV
jgi:hypothetical protein